MSDTKREELAYMQLRVVASGPQTAYDIAKEMLAFANQLHDDDEKGLGGRVGGFIADEIQRRIQNVLDAAKGEDRDC